MKKTNIFIGLIIGILLSLLYVIGFLSNVNTILTDNLYGSNKATQQITIITIDDYSLQELGRWPWNRSIYSNVLDQLSLSKVVGIDISFFEDSNIKDDLNLSNSIKKLGNVVLNQELTNNLLPIDIFKKNAKSIGYANIPEDKDGVNRYLLLNINKNYKSFSEQIYKIYTGSDLNYPNKKYYINYLYPDSFTKYSFSDLYYKKIPKEIFKNKIILIGSTSPDLHDEHTVPTSNGKKMSGVEIHANAIQTMLLNNNLKKQNNISLILELILLSFFLFYVFSRLNFKYNSILVISLIIVYIFICIFIFDKYNLILNLIYIPLSILLSYTVSTITSYIFQKKEKLKAIKAFSKYVSEDVVKEIMNSSKEVKLGGVKKEISILFADIRNFTTLSESLTAQKVVEFLNIYLSRMSNIILKNKGLIDKYIGDAIMAFWGAPIEDKNNAFLACKTALEMKNALNIVIKDLARKININSLRIGIGINTGPAVIGNIGSEHRLDYTAIGDNVNLASRIESLTKYYGVFIIVSENTYKKVKNKFIFRKIDLVKVKGKNKEVFLYELISNKDKLSKKDMMFIKQFDKAFELYLKGDFKRAIIEFKKANKIKEDNISNLLIKRCNELIKNTIKKWNGIYLMDHK